MRIRNAYVVNIDFDGDIYSDVAGSYIFTTEEEENKAMEKMSVLQKEKRGMLCTMTARGNREEILEVFATLDMVFFEVLPLSLEEIFISETEVVGYDIKKLIFS